MSPAAAMPEAAAKASKRSKLSPPDPPSGASTPKTPPKLAPQEIPVPAVAVEVQKLPSQQVAPPVPVLPQGAEATNYSEEKRRP